MAPLFDVSSVMFSYRVPGSGIQSGSGSGAEPGSGVSGSFSGRATINDTTVSLPAGRFYGIVGPNGCGKTTLIDLLMGQLRPDSGRVCFFGRDVSMIPARERARQMALVPQVYSVNFPFTVGEVVAMGRYPHLSRFGVLGPADMAIVTETMDLTDTSRFAHRRINQLSGGERQRVVFARALAQQAPVLFLDEATANLDINHSLVLLTLAANRVKDGGTVISVFQDINLAAMFCDHLLLMESGQCVAHGSIREVLTVANLNRLFGVQCQVEKNTFNNHLQVTFRE